METKIQKWGNSYGIRIPNMILKTLNIKADDLLVMENVDGKIVISKIKKNKVSLKDKFDNYDKLNNGDKK